MCVCVSYDQFGVYVCENNIFGSLECLEITLSVFSSLSGENVSHFFFLRLELLCGLMIEQ